MARFRGTGVDPRYPEGHIIDINEANASEMTLVSLGFVEGPLGPDTSDQRVAELAGEQIRGGTVTSEEDKALVAAAGLSDGEQASTTAYAIVDELPQVDTIIDPPSDQPADEGATNLPAEGTAAVQEPVAGDESDEDEVDLHKLTKDELEDLAAERGLDVDSIEGSGAESRVIKADLIDALEADEQADA